MAMRTAARYVSRRFSSGGSGRVLDEEKRAAENIYIKKQEQEKLEKLARKGPKPEEPGASSGGDAKPVAAASSTSGASTEKVSTDKNRNYAVVAGVLTVIGAVGWYLKSGSKKKEEVQD